LFLFKAGYWACEPIGRLCALGGIPMVLMLVLSIPFSKISPPLNFSVIPGLSKTRIQNHFHIYISLPLHGYFLGQIRIHDACIYNSNMTHISSSGLIGVPVFTKYSFVLCILSVLIIWISDFILDKKIITAYHCTKSAKINLLTACLLSILLTVINIVLVILRTKNLC